MCKVSTSVCTLSYCKFCFLTNIYFLVILMLNNSNPHDDIEVRTFNEKC